MALLILKSAMCIMTINYQKVYFLMCFPWHHQILWWKYLIDVDMDVKFKILIVIIQYTMFCNIICVPPYGGAVRTIPTLNAQYTEHRMPRAESQMQICWRGFQLTYHSWSDMLAIYFACCLLRVACCCRFSLSLHGPPLLARGGGIAPPHRKRKQKK